VFRYLKFNNNPEWDYRIIAYLLRKNTAIFFVSFLDLLSLFRHFICILLQLLVDGLFRATCS